MWLVPLLLLNLPTPAFQQDDPPIIIPDKPVAVPLATLARADGVRRDGDAPFRVKAVTIDGQLYGPGLMVDVQDGYFKRPEYSGLTIPLGGRFERFQATIGRDDTFAKIGPGYCYFELWGDGIPLFKSDPCRSASAPVAIEPTKGVRLHPYEIDIPVKGYQELRLVVRYANDLAQTAKNVHHAAGCVFADAKLLTSTDPKVDQARLKERDERARTAAGVALRALRSQLESQIPATKPPVIATLPTHWEGAISPFDLPIRAQISQSFFGGQGGRPLGTPLGREQALELREAYPTGYRINDDLDKLSGKARFAGATYVIVPQVIWPKLYVFVIDTRDEVGKIAAQAYAWLTPQ